MRPESRQYTKTCPRANPFVGPLPHYRDCALGLQVDLEELKRLTAMSMEERQRLSRELAERVRNENDDPDG